MLKNIIECSKIYIIILLVLVLFSCSINANYNDIVLTKDSAVGNEIINIANEDFIIENYNLFVGCKIYMLKSHQEGQMLSIVVKNKNDELIIFDGGRIDDGKYLCDFIKSFGGKVKYWFLTHIHDDHIGAIYEIFTNYTNDIYIENLCYNFADFDWYYERIGNDAGVVDLFENAKNKYVDVLKNKNLEISVNDKVCKNDLFEIEDIKVKVMNDIYKLDNDSVNNTSIVYKVEIENKNMIVLGDLGYEAGELLFNEYKDTNELNSDIVVVAHHGQGGVEYKVYQLISAKIALWPTTEYIYENKNKLLHTNDTKQWLKDLGVEENILSYISNYVIE